MANLFLDFQGIECWSPRADPVRRCSSEVGDGASGAPSRSPWALDGRTSGEESLEVSVSDTGPPASSLWCQESPGWGMLCLDTRFLLGLPSWAALTCSFSFIGDRTGTSPPACTVNAARPLMGLAQGLVCWMCVMTFLQQRMWQWWVVGVADSVPQPRAA